MLILVFFVLAKIHATYIVDKCYMLVQGRLAPLETHIKQDRRVIGAETNKKKRVIASLKGSEDQHGLSKVNRSLQIVCSPFIPESVSAE
jgi:hypothetical protein